MSKGKRGERAPSKGKKKVTFRWWGDWTVLWIFGGFGLAYLVFTPLAAQPLHWLFSFLAGVVGYGVGLFADTGVPAKVVPFVRHSLGKDKQKGEIK